MVAIIGGEPKRFPIIDSTRAGRRAGHSLGGLTVGLHSIGFLADSTDEARNFYPSYAVHVSEIGRNAAGRRPHAGPFTPSADLTGAC